MSAGSDRRLRYPSVLLLLAVGLTGAKAYAVPAFARQTGMSCSACHTGFPELTPFGRQFKATGYTMTQTKLVTETVGDESNPTTKLELPAYVPLGAMIIGSYTHTAKAQGEAKNDDVVLPDQLSLFYAGKIAPKVGGFIQLTYDAPSDHLGLDNTDLRFANTVAIGKKDLVYGVSVNNNPTVTDLWNSSPAWNLNPAVSSSVAPTPGASTLIEGRLSGQVAGVGAYAFYDNFIYAEAEVYRSAPLGISRPLDAATGATNVVQSIAPYWRVGIEKDIGKQSFMIGTFGMVGTLYPGGTITVGTPPDTTTAPNPLSGPTDHFVDVAADAQYQYIGDHHIVTAVASYVHEQQSLDASNALGAAANVSNDLHSLKVSASYLYERTIGLRAGFQSTRGSADTGLYPPGDVSGSNNGSPRSTSITGELTYYPWYNTRLGLQYVAYVDFNGDSQNYDGSGRAASDNNTVFGYVWLAF